LLYSKFALPKNLDKEMPLIDEIYQEPKLQDILADPDIRLLMNADGVEERMLLALCRQVADYINDSKILN
jgi:hypothetical protein